MYTFYSNYYVYIWWWVITYAYLCVFMHIKNHKTVWVMVFHTNCLYNGFSWELLVCYGFYTVVFMRIVFSIKRGYVYVWKACKNAWVLWLYYWIFSTLIVVLLALLYKSLNREVSSFSNAFDPLSWRVRLSYCLQLCGLHRE